MIRRRLADGELRIPQDEHARQAGRLAALLDPYPGDAVVRAVSWHDAGWPHPAPDFREAGDPAYGRRCVALARAIGRFEGLLVSRHFSAFSDAVGAENAPQEAAWRVGIDRAAEEEGLRVLQLCDAISLRVLCDAGAKLTMPCEVSPDGVVDPWPFRIPEFVDYVTGHWAQCDQSEPIEVRQLRVHFRPKSLSRKG